MGLRLSFKALREHLEKKHFPAYQSVAKAWIRAVHVCCPPHGHHPVWATIASCLNSGMAASLLSVTPSSSLHPFSAFHFITLNGLPFFPGKTPEPCLCPMRLDGQALPMCPALLPPRCPSLSAAATSASTQVLELTVPLLPRGPLHLLNLPPHPHDPLPQLQLIACTSFSSQLKPLHRGQSGPCYSAPTPPHMPLYRT